MKRTQAYLKRVTPDWTINAALHAIRRSVERETGALPKGELAKLEDAEYVVLQLSRLRRYLCLQSHFAEIAMVRELLAADRRVAVCEEPARVFGKRVYWMPPSQLYIPRLWDYSQQCVQFAAGLEAQGNRPFVSSAEALFWENKAHMHRSFDRVGIPSPPTVLVTESNLATVALPAAPLLLKEEHSAGSAGIHHFARQEAARQFAAGRTWAPGEMLIAQTVVPGATRDLRLTMVGDMLIPSATYWRTKAAGANRGEWTTTASTYNSLIEHGVVPPGLPQLAADYLRRLGLRTAGFDIIYENDDVGGAPLVLELSPIYQPNPPKPERHRERSYKQFKRKKLGRQTYLSEQFKAFREIDHAIISQGLL